jgi:hypothetical protein
MTDARKPARLKTYTAETGLVYQYYFVGKRKALDEPATEFVFDVSSDRKMRFSVSILVQDEAVSSWNAAHGRALLDAEIYAAAKIQLTRAFDEIEELFERGRRLLVDAPALADLLGTLGVE